MQHGSAFWNGSALARPRADPFASASFGTAFAGCPILSWGDARENVALLGQVTAGEFITCAGEASYVNSTRCVRSNTLWVKH